MTLSVSTPKRGVEKLIRNKSNPGKESSRVGEADPAMRGNSLVPSHSIHIWPAAVPLEDHLAAFAAKDDLEVAPPDRRGVAAAHRTGRHLVLKRRRQWLDLDL